MTNGLYAWAAGLIDGEGCIFIAKHKANWKSGAINDSYVLGLKVTMCHRETVERLFDIFGTGNVFACPEPKNIRWNQAYSFLAQSKQAQAILTRICPLLFTKKKEAEVALEFMQIPPEPKGGKGGSRQVSKKRQAEREKYWSLMRQLKGRE